MSKLAYLKQRRDKSTQTDIELSREVDRVYKDRDGDNAVYKEMLKDVRAGDSITLATVKDIGSLSRLFALVKKLEKKQAYIVSKEEPWFSTLPDSSSREILINLTHIFSKKGIDR